MSFLSRKYTQAMILPNIQQQFFTSMNHILQSFLPLCIKKKCATLFDDSMNTLSSYTFKLFKILSLIIMLRIICIKSFLLLKNFINSGGKFNAKKFRPTLTLPNWCWSLLILVLAATILTPNIVLGQYDWQLPDSFDEIRQKLDSLTMDNCKVLDVNRLFLPHSTVTHVPNLQWLGIDPIFPNRTNLLHVHNMALSRAFFLRLVVNN